MADTQTPQAGDNGVDPQKKPVDTQSAFGASTLMTDAEKQRPSQVASGKKRPGNLFRAAINTSTIGTSGLDPVYAAKTQLLNEALLDIGMGRYQWLLVLVTAVGWFLDNVSSACSCSRVDWALTTLSISSGWHPLPSSCQLRRTRRSSFIATRTRRTS